MPEHVPLEVACPVCHKTVIWGEQSPFRPFCSERCRMIDLGQWGSEQYSVPAEDQSEVSSDLNRSSLDDDR